MCFAHRLDHLPSLRHFFTHKSHQITQAIERIFSFVAGLSFENLIANKRMANRRTSCLQAAAGASEVTFFWIKSLGRSVDRQQKRAFRSFSANVHSAARCRTNPTKRFANSLHYSPHFFFERPVVGQQLLKFGIGHFADGGSPAGSEQGKNGRHAPG